MKPKNLLTALALTVVGLLATLPAASAGDSYKTFKETLVIEDEPIFRNTEFQIDAFYNQTFGPATSGRTINTGPGGGVSANVIFGYYFGLGVKNTWYANNGHGTYLLNPQAIVRYPIESLKLAPYATIGGGAGFGKSNFGFGSLGGGIEYRFNRNVGTFVDANWLFGAPNNAAVLTTGLRFAF